MKKLNILLLLLAIFVALTVLVSCNSEKPTDEECFTFYPLDDGTYAVECDATIVQHLTKIVIPKKHDGKKVSTIVNRAFYGCDNVKTIVIPNSVTSIGSEAFYGCSSLTSVEIPNGVTSIGSSAFSGCSSLTSLDVDESNPNYCDIDGILYTKDKETIVCYPAGKIESNFSIPNSVTSIGDYAFRYCSKLTSIVIPNSVTGIGNSAFNGCYNLTSIVIPNSVTSIGGGAFEMCYNLTSIVIGNSVTRIGDSAFYSCSKLTSIEIPNSVTSIGNNAFSGCLSLTNIVIPSSVTIIGFRAFEGCSKLTIYCEAESKPDGWDNNWNWSKRPVVWRYEK